MKHHRNEPCPCGSGEKYKRCCAEKQKDSSLLVMAGGIGLVAVVLGALGLVMMDAADPPERQPPPGKVWNDEHGHYHDVDPPALPEPGQVWSEEHGHYHDPPAQGGLPPTQGVAAADPGNPPPGKVWSEEHGHYHDAPAAQPIDPPAESFDEFELPPQSEVD